MMTSHPPPPAWSTLRLLSSSVSIVLEVPQPPDRATVPYTYRCYLLGIENSSRETSRNREVLSISFSESRTFLDKVIGLEIFLEKSPRTRSFLTVANIKWSDMGTQGVVHQKMSSLLALRHKLLFRAKVILCDWMGDWKNSVTHLKSQVNKKWKRKWKKYIVMSVGNRSRIPKLSLTLCFYSSIKTEGVLFFFIYIHIYSYLYIHILEENNMPWYCRYRWN